MCAGSVRADFMAELVYPLRSDCASVSVWEADVQLLVMWTLPQLSSLFQRHNTVTISEPTA